MVDRELEGVVESAAEAVLLSTGVTALAAGVIADGELAYSGGFGPGISIATAFRVASITKTFTAIALMQQFEAGRFALDDPINDHLKTVRVEPPAGAPPVTVKHLLTHSAGIGELLRVGDLRRPYAGFAVRPGQAVPSLRSVYEPVVRTEVAVETKYAYANHGFGLLGVLLEDLTGEEYGAYVRANVLDRLGMTRTDLARTARVGDDAAVGYRPRGARRLWRQSKAGRPAWDLELTVPPAGGAWSTIDDLTRYAMALLGGGANAHGRVLEPATLALMLEPHFRLDSRMPGRGLCFGLGSVGPYSVASHDGGLPGFSSTLQFTPGAGAAAIVFANANNLDIGARVHRLGIDLLRAVLGVPDPVVAVEASAGPERRGAWPGLRGWYAPERGILTSTRAWRGGGPLGVQPRDGHLRLRRPYGSDRGGTRLYPDADDPEVFQLVSRGLVGRAVFQTGINGDAHHVCLADDTGQHRLRRISRRHWR